MGVLARNKKFRYVYSRHCFGRGDARVYAMGSGKGNGTSKYRGVAPNLNRARNDTGRAAFCGPTVLSAITGQPVGAIEDVIRHDRDLPSGAKPVVKGTHAEEVAATLARFGYRMDLVANFLDRDRKERPTVWSWMQKRRNAWSYYILAIHRGREGHWILIRGVMLCDTWTGGAWTFVCDGPHRSARIMEVYEVVPAGAGRG